MTTGGRWAGLLGGGDRETGDAGVQGWSRGRRVAEHRQGPGRGTPGERAALAARAGRLAGYRAAARSCRYAPPPCAVPNFQVWSVIRGKGKSIPTGGTLVVGREQDCEGGCFDSEIGVGAKAGVGVEAGAGLGQGTATAGAGQAGADLAGWCVMSESSARQAWLDGGPLTSSTIVCRWQQDFAYCRPSGCCYPSSLVQAAGTAAVHHLRQPHSFLDLPHPPCCRCCRPCAGELAAGVWTPGLLRSG